MLYAQEFISQLDLQENGSYTVFVCPPSEPLCIFCVVCKLHQERSWKMAAATKQHKVSDSTGTNPKEAKKDRMKWAVRLLSWVPTLACLSLCALLAFRLVNLESKVEVIQWQLQKLQNIQTSQLHHQEPSVPRQKRSIQPDKTDEECSCTGLPGKKF